MTHPSSALGSRPSLMNPGNAEPKGFFSPARLTFSRKRCKASNTALENRNRVGANNYSPLQRFAWVYSCCQQTLPATECYYMGYECRGAIYCALYAYCTRAGAMKTSFGAAKAPVSA